MIRVISSMLIPVGLLVLVYFSYPQAELLAQEQRKLLALLPYAFAGILMLLCLRFNRGRIFFASLNLLVLYALIDRVLPALETGQSALLYATLSLLIPFNLMVFSELRERGVFTWWGSSRFALIFIPLVLGWAVIQMQPQWMNDLLHYRFIERELLPWITFPQSAQLLILITLLTMNGHLYARPDAQRGALFGSLLVVLGILYFHESIIITNMLMTAALLMFAVALIQDSWSMAYIDHLTGLPGRRAMKEHLLKLSGNYSIAMMDIDHFKKFNDKYGHDAGDEVLRMVAERLKGVGLGGKVYRYGGEEFTVIFPGKPARLAAASLESLREQVAESPFYPSRRERRKAERKKKSGNSRGVKITISIGVSERDERNPYTSDVLKAADKALYRAKKKGRNQVCGG